MEKGVLTTPLFDENKVIEIPKTNEKIIFSVQLAASKRAIEPKSYNFKGLKNISREKEGGYYKYYFGNTESYKKIQKEQRRAKRAGFKSAFIVSFKGNEKIKLSKALDALK